ncbi:MAG: AAA family ATPase [Alphaproteobacteria bacterium]|nr:AAA family ATPase [Alphaproteobacteria bacterium]
MPDRLPQDFAYTGKGGHRYYPSPALLGAANAALVLGAPLLLTGEAGCGKTDFAYAAASYLGQGPPERFQVRSDTRARDLLYRYDAVRRFGEIQLAGALGQAEAALYPDDPAARRAALDRHLAQVRDVRRFIRLEALGRAIVRASPRPRVVLIDEIDKAPRDMPNDLLMELEHLDGFDVEEIPPDLDPERPIDPDDASTWRRRMTRSPGAAAPLVVLTSNVERQLPDAFLRRCVFHHIEFPDDPRHLKRILEAHHLDDDADGDTKGLLLQTLRVFRHFRRHPGWVKKPGTSELIAWAGAVRARPDRGAVVEALTEIEGQVDAKQAPAWRSLPELGCLVKMVDDLTRLQPQSAEAR